MAITFDETCKSAGLDEQATAYLTVGWGFKSTLMFTKVAADEQAMMTKLWDPFKEGKKLRDVDYKCNVDDEMIMECAFRCLWTECHRLEKKKDEAPPPPPRIADQLGQVAAVEMTNKKALKT